MGWHINLVKNNVATTAGMVEDLLKTDVACELEWEEPRDVAAGHDGDFKLNFNDDHMEHMDFVEREEVQEVLKKHKAMGDICFSSADGDNAGEAWGYRFDGKGGMVLLRGVLLFKEVAPKKPVASAKRKPTKAPKKSAKGVTPSKSRKVTKRSRVGSPRPAGAKGRLTWACTACHGDPACPGFPGTDIRKEGRDPRYCAGCGESHSVRKIRL